MDLSASTFWWVAAGIAVAAELATGTFYLLMMAVGLGAAAIAAHLGLPIAGQLVAAAVAGGGATLALYLRRRRHPGAAPAARNRDMLLDIGQRVQVDAWLADGTATVHYRGATWRARTEGSSAPAPGEHVVAAVEGSTLVLHPAHRT
jgi:membrane protein implicated in regulation of membrane protease activity